MAEEIDHGKLAADAEADARHAAAELAAAEAGAAAAARQRQLDAARTVDARIAAHQAEAAAVELDTERRMLRSELAMERARSSSGAFAAFLVLGIVLAAILIAAFWWVGRPRTVQAGTVVTTPAAAPVPGRTVIVNPPAAPGAVVLPRR